MDLISTISRVTHPLNVAAKVIGRDRAAVVLIVRDSDELDTLFIKRKENPSDPWSGQIALPGGRFEPQDTSLIDTAIREAIEEIDIDLRAQGRLLGTLDDVRPANMPSLIVMPFVALAGYEYSPTPGQEIEKAFWAPLRKLERIKFETTLTTGRIWSGHAYRHQGYIIWGLTGQIIENFLSLLKQR